MTELPPRQRARPRTRTIAWGRAGWALLVGAGLAGTGWADPWRLFRAADGLSESLSMAVTVSPRGHLCVKHGEGSALSLMDGYVVRNLPVPGERIHRVYQNRAGRLWATYDDGLVTYAGESWERYPLTNQLAGAEWNQLRAGRSPALLPAQEDRVLMVFPERLVVFRAADRSLTILREARESGLERFTDLLPAANGGLWLTGLRGVAKSAVPVRGLNAQAGWVEHRLPEHLGVSDLQRPFEDDRGGLTSLGEAVSGRRVLVHFADPHWEVHALPEESLRFAWRGFESNEFWGVTLKRLVHFQNGTVTTVVPPVETSLVFDVAVQPRGAFWLATREGVLRYAPSAWRPPTLPVAPGLVAGLAEDARGRMWVAAEAGLFGAADGRWEHHPWPAGFEPVFRAREGVFPTAEGALLVTASESLWRFDPAGGTFEAVRPLAGRRVVRVVRRQPTGAYVLATQGEAAGEAQVLELFDGRHFAPWVEGPGLPPNPGEVFFLEQARRGDWWLGTSAGPAWWRDGRWQFFTSADGYTDDGAFAWLEWEDGRIWCAGLSRVHEFDGRRWNAVRRELDRANAMVRTSDGSVWVAANNGLHRFYRDAWLAVGQPEGLPDVATHSVFEDSQLQLWAGTSRGPAAYLPRLDIDAPRTLTIEWEQQGSATGEGTGFLTFTGRDRWQFTPNHRLVFAHRLNDGEWSAYAPIPTVRLRGLTQGRHKVEVRAMDRNWNVEVTPPVFAFRVSVPWYRDRRVVAAALAGLGLALVAGAIAINRHLRLRRSYADVGRQVEARTHELRRATEALAQSQKMTALGTLAAGIAHDFNNLLSIIKGSAQIIAANPHDRGKVLTRVSRILLVVDQASDVVRGLLGFGTATDRGVKSCNLNQLVETTVRLLSDRFRREIRVELDLAPDLPLVQAAADLVQQSLLNLVFNAADASPPGGRIEIVTGRCPGPPTSPVLAPAPAAGYAFVAVRDEGYGISPDVLPRIFEPFFTTKAMSSKPGRGLGLYMVYEFARETGHGLMVESQVGVGSTFQILLPLAETAAAPPSPAE
jgi:signal transduction histidine kinase